MNELSTEGFGGRESIPHDTMMVKHAIIHLFKPIEYTPSRVNPTLNYGLWMIMMYQCSSISYNKCTIRVQILIVEEAEIMWQQGRYGESLYLPLSFAVNPKLI